MPEGSRRGGSSQAGSLAVVMAGELLESVALLAVTRTPGGFAALARLVLEIVDIVHVAPKGLELAI